MPSETIYMKGDQWGYLDSLIDSDPGIENRSQAIQYLINQAEQREDIDQ